MNSNVCNLILINLHFITIITGQIWRWASLKDPQMMSSQNKKEKKTRFKQVLFKKKRTKVSLVIWFYQAPNYFVQMNFDRALDKHMK